MSKLFDQIQVFLGSKGFLLALTVLSMGAVMSVNAENDMSTPSETAMNQSAYQMTLTSGVQAYRQGDYLLAHKTLAPLHAQHPENSNVTYYLAITEAQLGRFQQAKKLYQEILTLNLNSDAAKFAAEGLKFLPAEATLDLPPRFQEVPTQQASKGTAQSPALQSNSGTASGQSAPTMTPQDMMAWQMMMGQTGMGGTGGMNAMPWMMPGAMGANGNSGTMDPSLMSTMMMNQMMQNMNLGGSSDENH